MSTPAIIFLAAVVLLLLTTLVAFGLGHKRWSWVSVAASFLVVIALGSYLYLVSQLLDFEWKWIQLARVTQTRLHEVRDAVRPSNDPSLLGRFQPIEGMRSISELERERDRWRRALERIDNWRGRNWTNSSFTPPSIDGKTPGEITLRPNLSPPPEAETEEDVAEAGDELPPDQPQGQPLDPGDTLYVFDSSPAKDDGAYLGSFLVDSIEAIDPPGTLKIRVFSASPPDAYDRMAWKKTAGQKSFTVYDRLPSDRWLAYSVVPRSGAEDTVEKKISPQPKKLSSEELKQLIPEPLRLSEADPEAEDEQAELETEDAGNLVTQLQRHALTAATAGERQTVPEAKWSELRQKVKASGREWVPGKFWAEFEFQKNYKIPDSTWERLELALGPRLADFPTSFERGSTYELAIEQAFALEAEGWGTIRKIFERRRLIDAKTLVHGSVVPGEDDDVRAGGLPALMQQLQEEIALLTVANQRLKTSQTNLEGEATIVGNHEQDLKTDLEQWQADVVAATNLAKTFAQRVEQSAARLQEVEGAIVALGAEYDRTIEELVRLVDRAAPPPDAPSPVPRF